MATRWGICSAGKISNDFAACLVSAPDTEHKVVAVAARNVDKAKEFADHFGIPTAYGSYEELAKNSDIEVVYIGAIHPSHKELCILFLNHGKHIVCEKPLTTTLKDTEEVLRLAEEKNLFLAEGFWTRYFPVYEEVRSQVAAGAIGELKAVHARMNHNNAHVLRMNKGELGGGGMLDLGCYSVQTANLFFKGRPDVIKATGTLMPGSDVDGSGTIVLKYPQNKTATLEYHTQIAGANNSCTFMGTKGTIEVQSPFWCPTTVKINGEEKSFPLIPVNYKLNYDNSNGFHYEANTVRQCLQKGLKESPVITHQDSRDIMYIMEEALKQIVATD
ncbi:trans-1,2-dihydrobenzene-1,2-diol dehydrogenase [Patella vulgata]|uniref:trans-1,2-dihydrobenzene-1,2-diol dehydrogenase n=1 Tax=Patella vulgata TaxID=6465 RepID=UPI00217F39DB|nr:trans-1,2-dihydrobenzene-1,2-diol dehydrogenase [Patella vulgata]XP_050409229.1 trans-1,2-dihydrobenzene-1,2-diol dehydrogenase [Patella vulgata]